MEAAMPRNLAALRDAEAACTRCPLYRNATQVVPGEGAVHAPAMMVGEQPGNDEDLSGHPFIGPAGKVLDRAIAEAGLDRKKIFVTNAVKHFKFEPRGKKRLHKKPNAHEIERCRWWNELERALVKPKLIIALGATATRSLLNKVVTIASLRGRIVPYNEESQLLVTIHPSSLLCMPEPAAKAEAYGAFVDDLRVCRDFLAGAA
jgi:uracil-DNA glycosylase